MAYINRVKVITAVKTQSVNQTVSINTPVGVFNREETDKIKDPFTIIIYTLSPGNIYYFRNVYTDNLSCNYGCVDGGENKTISIIYKSNGTSMYTVTNN